MAHKRQTFFLLVYLAFLDLFAFPSLASRLHGGEAQKQDRIRFGYSSISGSRIALWAAHDMSFFARQGLQSELIILSGIHGIQALIAGEIQFFLGATDSAALAAARGSDLIILATAEPIRYKLIVQPEIKTVADLKGRKIVIDRVGGTSYYISLRLLEKLGLKPQDLELVQVGGGGTQRVAAFKSGVISAVVNTSERFEQMKVSHHALADAIEMGIKPMGNSYMTTRSFRDRNRDAVQRTVRALVEARGWIKNPKNRDATLRIFSRYLRTDDLSVLDLYYRTYVQSIPLFPYTKIEDLTEFLSYLPEGNRALQNLNLAEFIDSNFLQRVEQEAVVPSR